MHNVQRFCFSPTFSSTLVFSVFLIKVIQIDVKWYLMWFGLHLPNWLVILSIFSGACHLHIFFGSLWRYTFRSFVHCCNWVTGWFMWGYWIVRVLYIFWILILYILDINPLSYMWFSKIFSHSEGFFSLLIFPWCTNVLNFDKVPFIYFCFVACHIQKIIAKSNVIKISMFYSKSYILLVLMFGSLIHCKLFFIYSVR